MNAISETSSANKTSPNTMYMCASVCIHQFQRKNS